MRKTRIVCISDTHRMHREFSNHYRLPKIKGDILVHTGDLDHHYEDFGDWFKKLPFKYKIICPGNHDYISEIFKNCHDPTNNCFVLCNSSLKIEGITFFGHPWALIEERWKCEDSEKYYKGPPKIPKCDILLTHLPPLHILDLAWVRSSKGTLNECNVCKKVHKNYMHWGSPSLLREIQRVKPKYSIFGHVHDDPGMKKIGDMVFVNASSYCVDFQKPQIFDYHHSEKEEEGEEEEKEGTKKVTNADIFKKERLAGFRPIVCCGRYLGENGRATETPELCWKHVDGKLVNHKGGYLTISTDRHKTISTTNEISKAKNWMIRYLNEYQHGGFYLVYNDPNNYVQVPNLGYGNASYGTQTVYKPKNEIALDLDAYDNSKVIGWTLKRSDNQIWDFK